MATEKMYSLWMEGFSATGETTPAQHLGTFIGRDLRSACRRWLQKKSISEIKSYWDSEKITWWGCRIYDNETDARKAFG